MPTAGTSVSEKSYRNSSNITDPSPVVSLRAKNSLPRMPSTRNFGDSPGSEPEQLREYAQWQDGGDPAAGLDFDKLHAELQGKLVLEFTVAPSGEVTMCRVVSSELNDPDLEAKIVARVKLFHFDARDVESITTTKPIDFFPS